MSRRNSPKGNPSTASYYRALYLRIFLGAYFTLTGINWARAWPNSSIRFIGSIFGTDLSGTMTFLEAKQNADLFSFLLNSPWRWLVLLFLLISCILFVWDRFPRTASWLLFVAANAMAYSAGGRHFIFEFCGTLMLAHIISSSRTLAKALRTDRHSLVLALVFACFGAMYGSAAISKLHNTGLSWVNSYSLPLMLRHHLYFSQTESFPTTEALNSHVLPVLLRVFDRPSYWSVFALAGVLIIEALSPFLILMEAAIPFAPFIWMALHVGMGFVIGIFSYSLITVLLVIGLPPLRLETRRARLVGFAYGMSLILLAWALPVDRYRGSSVVFPFGRSAMFSNFPDHSGENPSIWRLLFKNKDGGPISHRMLLGPTKQSAQMLTFRLAVDLRPLSKHGEGVCQFIRQRWQQTMAMDPPPFQVWSREIKADLSKRRIDEIETKLWDCNGDH